MAKIPKPIEALDRHCAMHLAARAEALGATQQELSRRSGISQNRVGIIFRVERPASVGEIDKLATALDTTAAAVIEFAEREMLLQSADFYAVAAHDPGTDHELEAEQLSEMP